MNKPTFPARPGYRVKVQRVGVTGGKDFEIRSLLDRQQYADPDGLAEMAGISPACWPLFGQIWPSAIILAGMMESWHLGSSRVLEIGCGLGLASMVIHRRQGDITASDCHPLAETFLQDNAKRNLLSPMKYASGNWIRPNPGLGRFDLIIGSDILYERDHPQQLADFIGQHAEDTANVLIVDPNRGNRKKFSHCLEQIGFDTTEQGLHTSLPDGTAYSGRLLHYRRDALLPA